MDLNIVITTFAFNSVHPRILEGHVTFGDPCQFHAPIDEFSRIVSLRGQ
jgi:hypothetical protein